MTLGIQPIHIVFVFIVALIVFGPKRLPEIGRNIGKALNEIRRMTNGMTDIINQEVREPSIKPPAGSAVPEKVVVPGQVASDTIQTPATTPGVTQQFCIQCGTPNVPEALFCNKCGTKLPEKDAGVNPLS